MGGHVGRIGDDPELMGMRRDLRLEQAHGLAAAGLDEVVERKAGALSWMHRRVALHVGKSEVALAIAAVGGTEQREERRVLREGKDLAVAERPSLRREVE